jgi:2-polyprenyl-3-methyl-5-hydroxy-6-metoxy-1,4-benzoquinol methylase
MIFSRRPPAPEIDAPMGRNGRSASPRQRAESELVTCEPVEPRRAADFPAEWYDAASEGHFWMEWRLQVILRQLARLDLDRGAQLSGFDIGCGHGAFARQLQSATAWRIDGCDVNETAFAGRGHDNGRFFRYDIFEYRPGLKEKYDLVFLLDVIEHIEDPFRFLFAARFYLKRGGHIVINVPAIPSLFSRYDTLAGHLRRYTRPSLASELSGAGLEVETITYWGLPLVPLAALRKVVSSIVPAEAVIRRGFVPPGAAADRLLRLAMSGELAVAKDVPWGTSLVAIARKAAP